MNETTVTTTPNELERGTAAVAAPPLAGTLLSASR
jgi:hypothetical protein